MVNVHIAKMLFLCKNTLHHLWPQRYLIIGFAIGYYTISKIPVTGEPVNNIVLVILFFIYEYKFRRGKGKIR